MKDPVIEKLIYKCQRAKDLREVGQWFGRQAIWLKPRSLYRERNNVCFNLSQKYENFYRMEISRIVSKLKSCGYTYKKISATLNITPHNAYEFGRYGIRTLKSRRRQTVIERDISCRMCKVQSSRLHIHHIDKPTNHTKRNLISLCGSCHMKAEKQKRQDITIHIKDMRTLISS